MQHKLRQLWNAFIPSGMDTDGGVSALAATLMFGFLIRACRAVEKAGGASNAHVYSNVFSFFLSLNFLLLQKDLSFLIIIILSINFLYNYFDLI